MVVLTNKRVVQNILKKHGLRPSKRLGQHFLISQLALNKLLGNAELSKNNVVLEIGPGIGTLTHALSLKSKRVIGIEKDPKMCEILKETLKDCDNVRILQKDILKLSEFPRHYKVVANLPFYLTAPVIRKLLEAKSPPELMVLIIQKEVAQRICALPPKMNILAVSVQFYASPKIIDYVPQKAFWPKPDVDAAIIKISRIRTNLPQINTNLFFKIVKVGFANPRKQLINNFLKRLEMNRHEIENWLKKSGIDPKQRAQTLSVEDWVRLTNTISTHALPASQKVN